MIELLTDNGVFYANPEYITCIYPPLSCQGDDIRIKSNVVYLENNGHIGVYDLTPNEVNELIENYKTNKDL